jgi:hypothetical protein
MTMRKNQKNEILMDMSLMPAEMISAYLQEAKKLEAAIKESLTEILEMLGQDDGDDQLE